ncbi:MAG: hypothetical protein M1828_006429 [Chrysothrix sp. TS-e1954]|nr:MAG: hypothetical protein M1828_006429 [Chrysothrix sp. TS-e1954]
MNPEDLSIARGERDASPERWRNYDPQDGFKRHLPEEQEEQRPQSSSSDSVVLQDIGQSTTVMQRVPTQTEKINTLEKHPTALNRIETHRTQHSTTVGGGLRARQATRQSTKQSRPLPDFGAGKPYPPKLPNREEYVVEFNGHDDPSHAQNWTMKRKLFIGAILAFDSLAATFGSSIFSAATRVVSQQYGVSMEVGTLTTSLYVLGYAFGPIIWAPISELYGRRLPIIIGAFGFGLFSVAVATAKDLQTIMLGRFFSGLFGSCPLAVVAAVFTDMFDNAHRGLAIAVFSMTVFMGPLLAPFIGGFITISYLGWRWTEYITAIMAFTAFILALLFQKESYPPVILVGKASELRRRTKNWGIHAKQEEVEVDIKELMTKNVTRPLRILFTEPIVLLVSTYMAFLYGLLYLFLTAYALVFQGVYGMNSGVGGLPYFGMVLGELIAFAVVVFMNKGYVKKLDANHNIPVPEWRLPLVLVGAVSFSVGLFWFGWTGYTSSIPWIVPTLSGLCTGFGIFSVFLQLLNYIVDAYLMFAASAIAGNTFLRSIFGAIFPLFATYMFDGMGINYAGTLLGCVAAAMVPLPIVFLLYGKRIRAKSKFAPAYDLKMEQKQRDLESGNGGGGGDEDGGGGRGKAVNGKERSRSTEAEGEKDDAGDGEPLEAVETNQGDVGAEQRMEEMRQSALSRAHEIEVARGHEKGLKGTTTTTRSREREREREEQVEEGGVQGEAEKKEKVG